MQEIKLPYGLKNGELVHISEVEQGVACQCRCPTCQSPLIARKGENNIHHFAHQNLESCQGALETSLHLAAKKVFEQNQYIVLPSVAIDFGYRNVIPNETFGQCQEPLIIHKENTYQIDHILLEFKLQEIIPDVIVYIHNKPLLIEIYVTHAIDSIKLQKIQQLGVAAIEIDLSKCPRNFHYDELQKMLVETSTHKKWVFNPKIERYKANLSNAIDIKPKVYADKDDVMPSVENCPMKRDVRRYRGKSYTEAVHNCWMSCKYCLDILFDECGQRQVVFCGGRHKITSRYELKQFIIT